MPSPSAGAVRDSLIRALESNPRQLGKVFVLDPEMNMRASELVELGGAANTGAVGNLRCSLRAILNGVIPNSPSVSKICLSAINGLQRDNPDFSTEVSRHLEEVRRALEDRASSTVFKAEEEENRRQSSQVLIEALEKRGGVYVYSLPHYLNYPCKEDPDRYWYKVGCTNGDFEARVLFSHRKTGLPEDPIVRRTYYSAVLDPKSMERKFHKLLVASGLQTDAVYGGVEWFATTEEQLDALAELLEFEISKPHEMVEDTEDQ